MLIWVCTHNKDLLGYLSVEDFCAMTGYQFKQDLRRVRDGVELYRTAEHIFGAVRLAKGRPTLQWSRHARKLEAIAPTVEEV